VPRGRGLWMFTVGRYEKFPGLANNPACMESKSSVISAGEAKANRKEPPLRQQYRPPAGLRPYGMNGFIACLTRQWHLLRPPVDP